MYCPECGDEFRTGFSQCPDCGLALIARLPPKPEPQQPDSVELLSTGNIPFLLVVKSLLDFGSIPYAVQGEEALRLVTLLPSDHFASPLAVGARLFVPEDRYEEALALVEAPEVERDG